MARRTVRINARLDPELARKVADLQRRTRKSLTDIVQESLDEYCERNLSWRSDALELLQANGYLGAFAGPADLSVTYKAELAESLRRKT